LGNLICYTINYDGTWDLTSAALGKYTRRDLADAWANQFTCTRFSGREHIARNKREQADFARILAGYILTNKCWDAEEGSKWEIETT
jgi:hypothetical protein